MTDQPNLEQLADWLHSPTTEWFFRYAEREWGPSGLKYQQAVRDASQNANAVLELQKVLYTQEQLLLLMRYPVEELKRLRDGARRELIGPSASRRGPGL